LDSSFGINGKLMTKPSTTPSILWSIGMQSDGKLLAAGANLSSSTPYESFIVRYTPDASLSVLNQFGYEEKIIIYPNPSVSNILLVENNTKETIQKLALYSTDSKLVCVQKYPNTYRFLIEGLPDGI